jgi:hypothetical protein
MNDDTKTREWPPRMPAMPWSDRVVPPEARTLCDMLTGPITFTIRPNASDIEVIAALRDAIDRWGSEESNLRATTKPICTDAK